MSPKVADPAVRMALIEQAALITAEEGRDALTLRRLARSVGASTMAVYTHFGSMEELRREVRREGFARLTAHLDSIEVTGDAVADLLVLGVAYYVNAVTNPNLYRAMFMDGPVSETDAKLGQETLERCMTGARRCIEAGRFDETDPLDLAIELWVVLHGIITLQIARLLGRRQAQDSLRTMARNLFTAFGDRPSSLGRSFARAEPRMQAMLPE
jgi:AcrR family transcriptional regulator